MAKAGFFHDPRQDNLDFTTCFLCRKSLDGWEKNDNPLVQHLAYSPDCGWAIVASIDVLYSNLSQEYPLSKRMIAARKATFGDRWPHERKIGWKCKVKQVFLSCNLVASNTNPSSLYMPVGNIHQHVNPMIWQHAHIVERL